jgi:membrane-associated phospholipid phosphatase
VRNALATVFKSGSLFIVLQLVLVAVSVVWLANVGRISAHTQINSWNSSALDSLMPYITDIGDGITITIACLLLFARNRSYAVFTGLGCAVAGGIAQLLKLVEHDGYYRPVAYFQYHAPDVQLHLVQGIEQHYNNSFPSGHTTAIFAFCLACALLLRKWYYQIGLLLLAVLVGYSRMYLSQHFLIDVIIGSLIGTCSSVFFMALYKKKAPAITAS